MRTVPVVATFVLAAASVLAGCSNGSVAGSPVPSATASARSGLPTTPAGNPTLSPRPAELKINGVDPCSLFPADRRAEFGVNQPPLGPTPKGNMTGCSFSSPTGGVGIYADPGHDAAYFLGDTLSNIGTEISVGGYPAVSGYPKTRKDSVCFIEIDVAEGQNLSVQYDDRAKRGPDALCPIAQKVALVALDALKAQKK